MKSRSRQNLVKIWTPPIVKEYLQRQMRRDRGFSFHILIFKYLSKWMMTVERPAGSWPRPPLFSRDPARTPHSLHKRSVPVTEDSRLADLILGSRPSPTQEGYLEYLSAVAAFWCILNVPSGSQRRRRIFGMTGGQYHACSTLECLWALDPPRK